MSQYYADYTIFITDADLCAQYQAQFPDGIFVAPATASVTYSAPVDSAAADPGQDQAIWTYGRGGGNAGLTTAVARVTIAPNFIVDQFFNLYAFTGAPGGTLSWRGTFLRRGVAGPVTKEALQTHRWMNGFEHAGVGDGESAGNPTLRKTRHASRTVEGLGLAMRRAANEVVTHVMPTTGTGFPTKNSWERLYVCLRNYPAANTQIWGTKGSVQAGTAAHIMVTSTGQLAVYNMGNQVFPGTLGTTGGQLKLNEWAKLDIIFSYRATGGAGGIIVYQNGVEVMRLIGNGAGTVGGAGGLLNTVQNHSSSACGNEDATANTLEIDYDDWSNKTQPQLLTGDDWNNGTHIKALRVEGFGASHSGTWVGSYQSLDGVPVNGQVESVDSATANVSMEITTNYADEQIGCSGLSMKLFHKTASATIETLGYSLSGGAFVMQNVTTATGTWAVPSLSTDRVQTLYTAGGSLTPASISSVNIKYTRDAVASSRQVQALQVDAEFIGVWGAEDPANLANPSEFPVRQGPHNAPWSDGSIGQTAFLRPNGYVAVMSGQYTGNGTGQDITLKMPAHWVWIRPLSGGTGGSRWWSSCLAGHDPLIETPNKGNFVRAYQTDRFATASTSYKFRVSGLNANSNANGVTYQYVAFADSAMRFCLNGAYLTQSALASFQHNLFDPSFTPTAGFLLPELGTNAATTGMYFKGPASAANGASIMDSAESATVCAFGAGFLTPKTIINLASTQTAYSLWRATDGDGVSGAVAITSYTGDGGASKAISLALGGRVPSLVIIQPTTGVAYVRDPGHTTASSNAVTGAANATAITAVAANQCTVGLTLNTNLTTYSVFAIAGQATDPTDPIILVDPIPPTAPFGPSSNNGWWTSAIKFTGAATVSTYPPTNPQDGRDWQKIAAFATVASGSNFDGGFPGPVCNVDNFMIYAGNEYMLGTGQPTIRIFDGLSDRLLITIPDVSGVKAQAIMSMVAVGPLIYLTTLDSGTSSADYAGRVFKFDPIALTLEQLGSQFTTGEVPYALCWHMNRLFMGTNKGGAAAKVYWFRPGIDTAWTTDRTLVTDGVGGALSMASFRGNLYVGCNATAAMGTNLILQRDSLGAWTTSFTLTSAGTFRNGNGVPGMVEFNGKLYASYWNNDTTPDCYIKSFDGSSWSTVYTGTGNTVRPFISLFVVQKTLFALGGGGALSACLLSTPDGATWTNLTAFLSGSTTTVTATPLVGQIGA